jgi:hypothetical protein
MLIPADSSKTATATLSFLPPVEDLDCNSELADGSEVLNKPCTPL